MRIPVVTHLMSNGLRRNLGDITCGPSLVPRSCVRRDFQSGPDMTATSRHRSDVQHLLDIKLHAFPLPKTEIISRAIILNSKPPWSDSGRFQSKFPCCAASMSVFIWVIKALTSSPVIPIPRVSLHTPPFQLHTVKSVWAPGTRSRWCCFPGPPRRRPLHFPLFQAHHFPTRQFNNRKLMSRTCLAQSCPPSPIFQTMFLSISVRTLIRIRCSAKERVPSTDPGWTIFVLPLLCKVDQPLLHFDSQFVILPCNFRGTGAAPSSQEHSFRLFVRHPPSFRWWHRLPSAFCWWVHVPSRSCPNQFLSVNNEAETTIWWIYVVLRKACKACRWLKDQNTMKRY